MRRAKIAFFGSSLVSAYWNGAATYYRGILKELSRLGYEIVFYEPDAFDRQKHRDISDPAYAKSVVYPADRNSVEEVLQEAQDSDIIIKASGVGVFDDFLEKEVLSLKAPHRTVVFWDVDAPATLERVSSNPNDPFSELISQFDLILTYGGGIPVVEAYRQLGAANCVPIYNALDPSTHFPVAGDPKFEADIGFLGNRMPDREKRVQEFFFKPAQKLKDRTFLLGGNGWEDQVQQYENIKYFGHVYTRQHNAFNCTPLAVLNINRQSMVNFGYSPATRIFEAAGAAACIITDKWKGIHTFLEPNRECLVAESGNQVAEILQNLDREKAYEIGQAARKRVLAEHTYELRAKQTDKVFQQMRQNKKEFIYG